MNQNRNNIDKLVIKNQNNHMRQPTNIDRIIARNMRIIRKSCQLNLKDVSNDLAVSYQQLRKYETSDNRISAGKLWELSLLYKTPVQKFFKDEL